MEIFSTKLADSVQIVENVIGERQRLGRYTFVVQWLVKRALSPLLMITASD